MTKRTEHRPVPRIEYRGHAVGRGDVLPPVEVVSVYETAEPLIGWNVGHGFAWGLLDDVEGSQADWKRCARRELAFRLVCHVTGGNRVLADELADGVVERLLLPLSSNYGWRITSEQLIQTMQDLLIERELAKYQEAVETEVQRLLEESANEAKRRRIEQLTRESFQAGRPVVAHFDYRDGESETIDLTADQAEEVIDLDAPSPPTPAEVEQLAHDPYRDQPDAPF